MQHVKRPFKTQWFRINNLVSFLKNKNKDIKISCKSILKEACGYIEIIDRKQTICESKDTLL